jgi:DNA-binding HxlR family transcriptional regulator
MASWSHYRPSRESDTGALPQGALRRLKRKSIGKTECPVYRALEIVGDWGCLHIVRAAMFGASRFREFESNLRFAKNLLTARLRYLVEQGILETRPASDNGRFKEYFLTKKGMALYPVVMALREWGVDYCFPGEGVELAVDAKDGKRLRRIEVQAHDGRVLKPADIRVLPKRKVSKKR